MVELVAEVTVLVVIVNVALVAFAATVTLAGTCAAAVLLLVSVTAAPPLGAGPLSVTVPCELVPPTTLLGFAAVMEMDCRVAALLPEEEQLPRTRIAQTQKMNRPNLFIDTKHTPHL